MSKSFKHTILDKIAGMMFKIFLWSNRLKEEEYWRSIYEQEKNYIFFLNIDKQEGGTKYKDTIYKDLFE